ncbi:MAG: NAD(P)/FAD-dependent oxidoreductase, partial [Candidatus Omnitrophica bacterium]|nr:NAD(P)/FAD-dependent oxidoreductase [Candidatus Omnitrophota bacterium]
MKYCIIGSGAAGVFAAKKIRQLDSEGEIVIFTDEKRALFAKPRLPEFLSGDCKEEDLLIFKSEWYEKQRIQVRTESRVREIIPHDNVIMTTGDERYEYDKLLIAAGSHPSRLPIAGFQSDNVYTVRTVEDIITLRSLAQTKKCCIVIGGGLLGIEIAYALSKLGLTVTVVEYFDRLIPRQLDQEGSNILKKILEEKGLHFRLGAQTTAIEDTQGEKQIIIKGQQVICCEFVVMSVGISPNIQLAQRAALTTNKGIIVNDFLKTTDHNIFAAGDCAEHNGAIYGLWSAAMEQGEIAGENMVDMRRHYEGSTVSTMLKVAGVEVSSVGEIIHKERDVDVV